MKQAAFQATVHGFRTIPSRGVISITIECPIEHHAEIARIAEHGAWVAVARLQEPKEVMPNHQPLSPTVDARPDQDQHSKPDRAKRDWRDLGPAQQAGIRCDEPSFTAFLKEQRADDWYETMDAAACMRLICGVDSRAHLATNQRARVIWHQLDQEYQAWLLKERVGA
jgi:hypothetical protein